MGVADSLAQAHAALEVDRAREQRRRSFVVRWYLLAEGGVFAAYTVLLLRFPGDAYSWLAAACAVTAAAMFAAIRVEVVGRHALAGVLLGFQWLLQHWGG